LRDCVGKLRSAIEAVAEGRSERVHADYSTLESGRTERARRLRVWRQYHSEALGHSGTGGQHLRPGVANVVGEVSNALVSPPHFPSLPHVSEEPQKQPTQGNVKQ